MKKLKKELIPLSFMLSIIVSNFFYKILNNGEGNINSLVTSIDKAVPFLKIFILPYITWYGFIALGLMYLCFKNHKTYYISLISLNIGLITCYIIYAFFQTTVPRPTLTDSGILTKLVNMIYKHDNPFNCFPSVHVTTTYITLKGINKIENSKIISFVFNITGILIILSTQLIKQHVILDLVAAILLCEVIFRVVNNTGKESITIWKRKLSSIWIIKSKLKNPS